LFHAERRTDGRTVGFRNFAKTPKKYVLGGGITVGSLSVLHSVHCELPYEQRLTMAAIFMANVSTDVPVIAWPYSRPSSHGDSCWVLTSCQSRDEVTLEQSSRRGLSVCLPLLNYCCIATRLSLPPSKVFIITDQATDFNVLGFSWVLDWLQNKKQFYVRF
jgi:hypothetical protein